jgi:hypothetical protein
MQLGGRGGLPCEAEGGEYPVIRSISLNDPPNRKSTLCLPIVACHSSAHIEQHAFSSADSLGC